MRKNWALFLAFLIPALGFCVADSKYAKKSNNPPPQPISAWPVIQNDIGLCISADFLYWKAEQTGMAYGYVNNYNSTPNFNGSYKNVEFELSPGVRTAIGIRPHYDFWQINVVWTHLNTQASGATQLPSVSDAATITPFYNVPVVGSNGTAMEATWKAWYNTLDLDLTKEITNSHYFGIKAHLGLRNLWLHESYRVVSINNSGGFPGAPYNSDGIFKEQIWGIGPMLGLDSTWNVGYGLSLFGKASFSMLWSHIHSTEKGSYLLIPPVTSVREYASFHTTLPEITLVIGTAYDTNFYEDRYHIALRLGWELRSLLSANFLTNNFGSQGPFNLSGLTAGFDFDF